MSPEEFEKEMECISKCTDIETSHINADLLMCRVLTELGFGRGIDIFESMHKWYA